jgi:hypothetical protein
MDLAKVTDARDKLQLNIPNLSTLTLYSRDESGAALLGTGRGLAPEFTMTDGFLKKCVVVFQIIEVQDATV